MNAPSDKQRATTEELVTLVYDELRQIAHSYFRKQPPGFTLQPTEVVNEACLQLIQRSRCEWQSSAHFRAIATKKIWQVVIDHLRKRLSRKRGGPGRRPSTEGDCAGAVTSPDHDGRNRRWKRIPLDSVEVEWHDRTVDLLDLADALDALEAESHRPSEVVQLHWFGGLKYADVANYLGVSVGTVEKDFRYALSWLNRRLAGADTHAD